MSSILEQIKPETAATIAAEARARGLSVDEYLNTLLPGVKEPPSAPMTNAEIDQILDELSKGTDNLTPLPKGFSREDIYFDHD